MGIEECHKMTICKRFGHSVYPYEEILCCLENFFPVEYVGNQENIYRSINVKRQLK